MSIANSTEYGTVYTPQEVRAIADACHKYELFLHMDGCRLPNAAVAAGASLREITRDAGVDVLSFGGAKNGLMSAEAVVVFRAPDSDFMRMQKQAMQLVSKVRFVSGQFVPYLQEDLWEHNARHANALARLVADGLVQRFGDTVLTCPVETNQVFCRLPARVVARIRQAGHCVSDWLEPGEVRFALSWDNTKNDVQAVVAYM